MKIYQLAALLGIALAAPVNAAKAPQLSGLELQQIQARDFETTKDIAFASVMTVLQDAGYRIGSADRDTGLITGTASTSGKTTFNLWFGLGSKKQTPIVSAYVEARGPHMARVRFNFVLTEGKSRNAFSNETPIVDPAIYKDAFEKVEKEIFVRQSMDAPTPAAPPAATPATAHASAPRQVSEHCPVNAGPAEC